MNKTLYYYYYSKSHADYFEKRNKEMTTETPYRRTFVSGEEYTMMCDDIAYFEDAYSKCYPDAVLVATAPTDENNRSVGAKY